MNSKKNQISEFLEFLDGADGSYKFGKEAGSAGFAKLDMVESELVLVRLLPQQDKEIIDWKKLLGKAPVLGIQVIRDRVIVSALDLFEYDFYRVFRIYSWLKKISAMAVGVKDEINLLPVIEDWTPSSSMVFST
ncbi:28709_t:CDS:2 [Dentiscutata erythropus]|uniref:28709_t:CDS:1 n=1 Tax=Dentiscutata erythropus TaxID=1348616 RepID=A0A9N9CCE1_9GLOM|nr:28709_t:CDS:2 [Dentiscutata erythropus]